MNSEEKNRRFLTSSKKQKTDKSKEGEKLKEELKERIEIIDSDPSILDIEPLQIRHPIIDWEIHNDGFMQLGR